MNNNEHIDDNILAAFVDNELDTETSESIINAMEQNMDVRERVYNLRRAKDLMKVAFSTAHTPAPQKKIKAPVWKRHSISIAASLVAISIASITGLSGYYYGQQELAGIDINTTAIQQQPDKILLHISDSDTRHFATALNYVETFLQANKNSGAQIAVVANAGGLDIMRAGVSPYEKQIRNMIAKYDNVYFIACSNAIRNLRAQGIQPILIDQVKVEKPAMDQIIEYVQKGWTYKKVQSLKQI